jgi:glutaminyl-tRNA synthetase
METSAKKTNFIWEMIEQDLQSGRYQSVRTRFPPEPNGYLHIGHCKAWWRISPPPSTSAA